MNNNYFYRRYLQTNIYIPISYISKKKDYLEMDHHSGGIRGRMQFKLKISHDIIPVCLETGMPYYYECYFVNKQRPREIW